jgi:hypothetical protein
MSVGACQDLGGDDTECYLIGALLAYERGMFYRRIPENSPFAMGQQLGGAPEAIVIAL